MTEMESCRVLYRLMAERFERNRFGRHQAEVYRATLEFMKDCVTSEEATEKIKHSEYYLAPSKAVVLDMIDAHRQAALESDMPKLVELYDRKIAEIEKDLNAIYDGAYLETAKHIRAEYLGYLEAFAGLFTDWLTLRLANPDDEVEAGHATVDFEADLKRLGAADNSKRAIKSRFDELSGIPAFRSLIPVGDFAYASFVQQVGEVILGTYQGLKPLKPTEDAAAAEWAAIEAEYGDVSDAGRRYLSMTRDARVTANAPNSVEGKYTYSNEKVR